ncbi:MAG: LON peptidase substrate-binding domain-containing protein, partial [Myxococcales bacterium]
MSDDSEKDFDDGQEWSEESVESAGGDILIEAASDDVADFDLVDVPDVLPVLPLKNVVLFPHMVSPLLVNTVRSKHLIDEVAESDTRLMVCSAVKHTVEGSPGPDDVYAVGTVLRIIKMIRFPDNSYRLLVQGIARVAIDSFLPDEDFLRGNVRVLHDVGDRESVETAAQVRNVSQQFASLVSESPRLSDELHMLAASLDDPSRLGDLVTSNLDLDVAGKQQVLETTSIEDRLKDVLAELMRQRDAMEIETEIRDKVQTEMGRSQRDYMLRQQLEAIRRELGEVEDDQAEADRMRERI